MKAIVIAGGMGKRLAPYTDDRPKCLVEINGKSILARQLTAYRGAGVNELVVVRGYQKARLAPPLIPTGTRTYDNDRFATTNVLTSLFCAEPALADGFLFSYSDIVFDQKAVQAALEAPGDFALVIDRRWSEAYDGRTQHPVAEAEVARVASDGRIMRVGKRTVAVDEAQGEFIGLGRVSVHGAKLLTARYHQRKAALGGTDKPYGRAATFEMAMLTDLFNDLIDSGTPMYAAYIDGGWRELDTVEDLQRAEKVFK